MFYRAFIISVFSAITVVFCTTASAEVSAIQGEVRGMDGQPMKGAQMRIERKDQKSGLITTTTDAMGHYAANKLPLGIYRVSVIGADGTVKSGTHIRTTASSVKVDFDLKPRAKKINHFVWIRPETGSHMAGRWVPVDEYGTPVAGTFNSQTASGELARDMTRRQRNGSPY